MASELFKKNGDIDLILEVQGTQTFVSGKLLSHIIEQPYDQSKSGSQLFSFSLVKKNKTVDKPSNVFTSNVIGPNTKNSEDSDRDLTPKIKVNKPKRVKHGRSI